MLLGILCLLGLLSIGAFLVSIVLLVIRAVKKQRKKPIVIMASSTLILFIVLLIPINSLSEPSEKTVSNLSKATVTDPPESSATGDNPALESDADTGTKETTVKTKNMENQAEQEKAKKKQEEKEAKEKAEQEAKEKAATEKAKKEKQKKAKKNELKKVSNLKFDGEPIIDSTIEFMKEYEYVKDIYIEAKEDEEKINIAVQVPSATDFDVAKMAGEDAARYLASVASYANSYYEVPGVDSIGSLYNKYSLLIYIDDGYGNFNIYGAKVTTAKDITWRS